jgi:hypothetical protein
MAIVGKYSLILLGFTCKNNGEAHYFLITFAKFETPEQQVVYTEYRRGI